MDALYGEASPEALSRVEAHHAQCAACRQEFEDLRAVRGSLVAWRLPETLVRGAAKPARVSWPQGLAWAAGLLLALSGAIRLSGASIEWKSGPLNVRLGRAVAAEQITSLETRHQRELEELRSALASEQARRASAMNDEAILEKVRAIIRDNEAEQAQRMDAALERYAARSEAQRRYDLARVSAGLSYLDGKTGQHVARTNELMGYVLQASEKR